METQRVTGLLKVKEQAIPTIVQIKEKQMKKKRKSFNAVKFWPAWTVPG